MADPVDVEVLTRPEQDPRIDAACKALVQAHSQGACDGFPDPCDMCDCFYQSEGADQERDIMRRVLAAADLVDPVRGEVRLHRQQRAAIEAVINNENVPPADIRLGYEMALRVMRRALDDPELILDPPVYVESGSVDV